MMRNKFYDLKRYGGMGTQTRSHSRGIVDIEHKVHMISNI
jgi:hypothetical protein